MILIPLVLAVAALNTPTETPGAEICATLPITGPHYVRCTAFDSEGNESGLSNEILKTFPEDICWLNPTENVDGTPLVDLTSVRCYYSTERITSGFEPPPGPPDLGDLSADCAECAQQVGTLVAGETGEEFVFSWAGDGTYQLQLVEFGKDAPLLVGSSGTGEWRFTPTRAGLYEVRLTTGGDWIKSSERGLVFYFKLASASGGGIE